MGTSTSCSEIRKQCSTCSIEAGRTPVKLQQKFAAPAPAPAQTPLRAAPRPESARCAPGGGATEPASPPPPEEGFCSPAAASPRSARTGGAPPAPCAPPDPGRLTGVSPGYLQAMRGEGEEETNEAPDEPEPAPEDQLEEPIYVDKKREMLKASAALIFVVLVWAVVFLSLSAAQAAWETPECPSDWSDVPEGPPRSCERCAKDLLLLPLFSEWERSWPKPIRAALYLVGLAWSFLGVGIVCDQFMDAISVITQAQRVVYMEVRSGAKHRFHVDVWNPTVANLTLMALGSSAPEILLAVIEIQGGSYFAGELGPSTIVGSAAFNLLIITAVCITALPPGEVRRILQIDVFSTTSFFSVFAYLWMLIVLQSHTPDKVDLGEAVATLLMFPFMVLLAYWADRGYFRRKLHPQESPRTMERTNSQLQAQIAEIQAKFGKDIPADVVYRLMKTNERPAVNSKTEMRKGIMRNITGGSTVPPDKGAGVVVGFANTQHNALECAGSVSIKVAVNRPPGMALDVRYSTRAGTARPGVRYRHTEGHLRFASSQTEHIIEVPLIDDEIWQPDEYFECHLTDLQAVATTGGYTSMPDPHMGISTTRITVLNDDMPGTLSFDLDEVCAVEGVAVTLGVVRTNGKCGKIQCRYSTVEGSAIAGKDFEAVDGWLEFEDGETHKTIEVPIIRDKSQYNDVDEMFKVKLSSGSAGVKFDRNIAGDASSVVCEVILPGRRKMSKLLSWFFRHFLNYDKHVAHRDHWIKRCTAAFYCNGSPEEQTQATSSDWFLHCASLTFKVFFCLIPPTSILGGWLCFVVALLMIGLVTAIVADLATLSGCCLGVNDDITAITLVALGTSLPDTLPSRMAAQEDENADNAIGNITGSNSVNVFLGLGLPWSLAALHWNSAGITEEWKDRRWQGQRYEDLYLAKYPGGGFIVPSGSLTVSVSVFAVCATLCLILLAVRRRVDGGELGGSSFAKVRDSVILILLWFVYVIASILGSIGQ